MRGFREIRSSEKITDQDDKNKAYLKIKPIDDEFAKTTMEELDALWAGEFRKEWDKIIGEE